MAKVNHPYTPFAPSTLLSTPLHSLGLGLGLRDTTAATHHPLTTTTKTVTTTRILQDRRELKHNPNTVGLASPNLIQPTLPYPILRQAKLTPGVLAMAMN